MAGATSREPGQARAVVLRKSSASPSASLASVLHVAGATQKTSAQAAAADETATDDGEEPAGGEAGLASPPTWASRFCARWVP